MVFSERLLHALTKGIVLLHLFYLFFLLANRGLQTVDQRQLRGILLHQHNVVLLHAFEKHKCPVLVGSPLSLASLSSVLAMSSAEAELIALCACAADVAYCGKLANELGFLQLRPTIIHEDNLGAKQITESGNFKGRSKHFELRWRFLHHYINRGIVSIKAVKHDLQLADVGTASRGYPQLQQMGAIIHGEA